MTVSGIQQGEFGKQYQALNEASIFSGSGQHAPTGEKLLKEFSKVLDKIAVALTAGPSESPVEEAVMLADLPARPAPVAQKPAGVSKEAGPEDSRDTAREEANQQAIQEKADNEADEHDRAQVQAQTDADKASAAQADRESEEEAELKAEDSEQGADTDSGVDTATEKPEGETQAATEETDAVVEMVAATEQQAVQAVTASGTREVQQPVDSSKTEKSAGSVEVTDTENGESETPEMADAELLRATRQLAESKLEAKTAKQPVDTENAARVVQMEEPEQAADDVVKQFMDSLRSRLQANTAGSEEKQAAQQSKAYTPQFSEVAQAVVPDTLSQQVAATVLPQILTKNIVQTNGEAGKGLTTAMQNVIGAGTLAGSEASGDSGASGTRETHRLPRSFESRTLAKVEEALKEVARSKDGKTISVRLDPPSLGKVKVDVTMRDGVLHARLQADSTQVGALLREHGLDLQYSLRRLGLEADDIRISVANEAHDETNLFENFTEQGRSQNGNGNQRGTQSGSDGAVLAESTQDADGVSVADDHWVA